MMHTPRYFAGLCAIVKDETPFLREWVAYHYYIGFERIFLYDNESAIPVRETLADFCAADICETYTIQGLAQQNVAYNHCATNDGLDCEWLAFFDLDEFLCLKEDDDVRILLQDYEAYAALSVQWDLFSSSGHITRPQGFVTLNYRQSLGEKEISKCLIRPRKFKWTYSSHHFGFTQGYAVNAEHEVALGGFAPQATDKVCLNHYMYRSQQDYGEKLEKTDATFGAKNSRRWEDFFAQARKPWTVHKAIVPVAAHVQALLQKGLLRHKYPVTAPDVANVDLKAALALLQNIARDNAGLAEVVFALCRTRFATSQEFLRQGLLLCQRQGKKHRALALARQLLALDATQENFLCLLTALLAAQEQAAAQRLAHFLRKVAAYQNDGKLADGIAKILSACEHKHASQRASGRRHPRHVGARLRPKRVLALGRRRAA
ncbi:MAG: glycosyltransferase family 2 protein [Desulfovibrio sp.]|nr:glycosyltransferase family 2 protein [Desulfovibrio sp.]